jgi:hypothetical protein
MGLVSSICKRKTQDYDDTIVHNSYTQTVVSTANTSPSMSSEKTQCSAISREPTNNSSFRYNYYFPSQQQIYSTSNKPLRGHPDFPLFSTSFYLPSNSNDNITYRHSNPYIAQAYSHMIAPVSPLIHNTDHSRTTRTTSTSDPSRITTVSDIVQTTGNEYRTLTRVDSSITTDTNEPTSKESLDDEARLIKRSISAPIDMFLIDISKEHVLIGQPVSMNIRHLLLDTLENRQANLSTPIRIEPAAITTYAHENLLTYIPYVCERYPNVTVDSDQVTRNTLHVRVPSQFSHSLNTLS